MQSKIMVTPTADNKYLIEQKIIYKDITIPKGYKTNGADVPRLFWSIIPPFKPKYLPAVIVHDYLCDLEQYVKADKYFEEILLSIENSVTTKIMVKAVKFYHKIRYKK